MNKHEESGNEIYWTVRCKDFEIQLNNLERRTKKLLETQNKLLKLLGLQRKWIENNGELKMVIEEVRNKKIQN